MRQSRLFTAALSTALGASALAVLALAVWTLPETIQRRGLEARVLHDLGSEDLSRDLSALGYDLEAIRQGKTTVPRVYVTSLPKDLPQLSDFTLVKSLYLRSLLPLILMANRELAQRRKRIQTLIITHGTLEAMPTGERAWILRQMDLYGVEDFAALPRHIDGLPPGLVLAQAIQESGWGRSRFAQDGNAQFGQRRWGRDRLPSSEQPRDLGVDAGLGVRAFPDLMASVRSYMHNINSHPAYAGFRTERARQRAAGQGQIDSTTLLPGLSAYSEQGAGYLKRLGAVMADNRLAALDRARLAVLAPR